MLSTEDLAAIRIAVELCNNSELKKEILCAPGSEYERYKSHNPGDNVKQSIKQWHEMVENKATVMVEKLCLIKQLKEKVVGIVILIGTRMLKWAKYHERILRLTREFSMKFLNSSFFTSQGILDNKKAAEELMKEKSLSIKQKYKIACLYCFTGQIPDLYRKMSQEDKKECCEDYCEYSDEGIPHWIELHGMVKFWSHCFIGERDPVKGHETMDHMLESAVNCGSKAAVEYLLEKTDVRREEDAVTVAALETLRNAMFKSKDWEAFQHYAYAYSWVPSDYFVDILCFLLSKMTEDQLIEFLKRDIEDSASQRTFQGKVFSWVLEYFLSWPHQNYFRKTVQLMWNFLPERTYANLLLIICNKINPSVEDLNYGEERLYDYRKLLRELWCQSPDRYKRYVFRDKKTILAGNYKYTLQEGKFLLFKLFTLKNFTYEDRKNIELILDSATDEEKESIVLSEKGKDICIRLMKEERWEILEEFTCNCLPSKGKEEEFKRKLSITEEAQRICINFIKDQKWESAEFFIKWSSLPEEKIILLKREMIYCYHGRFACWHLFLDEGVEITNKFCEWFLSSEEEIREFKKKLVFSIGLVHYADLIREEKLDVVDEFVKWSLLSHEEIGEFKKELRNEKGNYICEYLISKGVRRLIYEKKGYKINFMLEFKGGKWEEIEKFLTWCFSSELEISDFKRRLLKESGKRILLIFIESNQWQEVEKFLTWLRLSPEEIKELKKETLWNYGAVSNMFSDLLYSSKNDKRYSDYGSKQEAIEIFLRWFLTDKETVLEFRDHFKQRYNGKELTQEDKIILMNFDSTIQRRLSDLDEEPRKDNLD